MALSLPDALLLVPWHLRSPKFNLDLVKPRSGDLEFIRPSTSNLSRPSATSPSTLPRADLAKNTKLPVPENTDGQLDVHNETNQLDIDGEAGQLDVDGEAGQVVVESAEPPSHDPQRVPRGSRKRRAEDDEKSDSDGGEDRDEDDKGIKHPRRDLAPLLACPFYKNDMATFRTWRLCAGPGWTDSRRLKEHLSRRHTFQAHKCESNSSAPRHKTIPDGLSEDQLKQLASRKRTKGAVSTQDKWKEIYKIVFPGTADEDIPSPCFVLPFGYSTRFSQKASTNIGIDYDVADDTALQQELIPSSFLTKLMALRDRIRNNFPSVIESIFGAEPHSERNKAVTSWVVTSIEELLQDRSCGNTDTRLKTQSLEGLDDCPSEMKLSEALCSDPAVVSSTTIDSDQLPALSDISFPPDFDYLSFLFDGHEDSPIPSWQSNT